VAESVAVTRAERLWQALVIGAAGSTALLTLAALVA